jgi:predicted dehydrogenase
VEACAGAGVHGAVAHVERYNPALVALKRMLRDGAIGRPVAIASERAGPLPVQASDTGVISDLATHDLDLIPWLLDEEIELVFAQTDSQEPEHVAAITGRLSGGTIFNTIADWLSNRRMRRVRVLGENGSLLADLVAPQLLLVAGDVREVPLQRVEPLASQFETFCDLLEGCDGASIVSLEESLRAVACADAAVRSARDGRAVTL